MKTVLGRFLVLFVVGCLLAACREEEPMEYYLSPEGSDENDGTLENPWQTIGHALGQLTRGDVLYLREGTYYENEIDVSLEGTSSAPITIQSYPGERAVIDGGVPDFLNAPNSEWELVDDSIDLYRSKRTFSGDFIRAWLVDDDIQLVEYETSENLESTNFGPVNGLEPFYMGPGVQLRDDGHVYIRLQYNPNDLTDPSGNALDPVPADTDPNHNNIAIFDSDNVLFLDGASYINFRDLDFAHSDYVIDTGKGNHHIELSNCRVDYSRYGLVLRDGNRDWEIHDCEFNNGLPDYVYWTDVKDHETEVSEAYPEFQSTAITGAMPGFNIHDNVFRNAFDGLMVKDGTADAKITDNVFKYARDDAINLLRGLSNVEVANNMLWHVGSGISNMGSDEEPGHIYIHHNVIDNSAYQRGGRPGNDRDWPVWTVISPFGSHGSDDERSWWKVYNNTIVTRRGGGPGNVWPYVAAGPSGVTATDEKYVYNNIFYVMDERIVNRNDLESSGAMYDGNVFYRGAPETIYMFVNFGDGEDYFDLEDFRQNSGTDWEVNGLEVDPGFDVAAIEDPEFDPATIWERYRPLNPQMNSIGASYDGLDWPGIEGVDYRGAIAP